MTRRILIPVYFFLFILVPAWSYGQLLDSIKYSLKQRPKFFLSVNTYNCYIGQDFANFTGVRIGLNYNHRVRFGLGYFGLDGSSVVNPITVKDDSISYTTNGDLSFGFVALSVEYTFYNKYPWQFSAIPLQFGIGSAHYEYIRRSDRKRVSAPSESVYLWQPDLSAQYNIFNWLGVGASVGYRVVIYSGKNIRENFNSPTFSLGLKLFLDEIYKSAFPNGINSK